MKLTGSPATDQSGTDCSHCSSASVRCSFSRGAEETTRIIIGLALITTWFNTSATLEGGKKRGSGEGEGSPGGLTLCIALQGCGLRGLHVSPWLFYDSHASD